ncbi:MAG: hypothetical protein GXY77_17725 [Fibrobacter sp.]|nr:hypothetical protein [Fibrobacter sp.]
MKSRPVIITMIASWIFFIALDGIGSLFRAWYIRRMKNPFRFLYQTVGYGRTIVLFLIAVMNFFLILCNWGKKKTE